MNTSHPDLAMNTSSSLGSVLRSSSKILRTRATATFEPKYRTSEVLTAKGAPTAAISKHKRLPSCCIFPGTVAPS